MLAGLEASVISGWGASYVLHEAAVRSGRAAEVGDLQADVEVRSGVRDWRKLVSSLYGLRSPIQ